MSDENRTYRSAAWFGSMIKMVLYTAAGCATRDFPTTCSMAPGHWNLQHLVRADALQCAFRQIAEHVKRGIWEAGGFPLEFPVMSMGETNMRPTAMFFWNLLSMDSEESIRASPIDGSYCFVAVTKRPHRWLWAVRAVTFPHWWFPGGPMLNGNYRG
jgi:L-arabonate dehydrase